MVTAASPIDMASNSVNPNPSDREGKRKIAWLAYSASCSFKEIRGRHVMRGQRAGSNAPLTTSGGTWDGGREKAPAAICRKVLHAKLTGSHQIEIWGDGRQTRSFMYIDDCLRGIKSIFESDIPEPINLGSSELVTIDQLVSIVEDIARIKLKRHYNLSAPRGVNGRNSDNAKILHYLGWEPSTRLRDGLAQTYAWIESQMLQSQAQPESQTQARAAGECAA